LNTYDDVTALDYLPVTMLFSQPYDTPERRTFVP
jgi:hypothetical protein